jgi:hypothetical protein
MNYREELKDYALKLKRNGMSIGELAKKFTDDGKEKLSGGKSAWSKADISYIIYSKNRPQDNKDIVGRVFESNLSADDKITVLKSLMRGDQ